MYQKIGNLCLKWLSRQILCVVYSVLDVKEPTVVLRRV